MLMLKRLLRSEKMSQKDLAAQLGIDEASMSLIVNGRRDLSIEMRKAIDALFGADKVAQFDIQPITQPTQVQATIYPSGVIDDLKEELRSEYSQPKAEDAEIIETLEAIPIVSLEQAKAPDFDVKRHVFGNSSEIERRNFNEWFVTIIKQVGLFDVVSPVVSDRMMPTYMPNDRIFSKYLLHATNDTYIEQGIYLLDTDSGNILCNVRDLDNGSLELAFDNSRKYRPRIIKKKDVKSIAQVVMTLRFGTMAFDVMDIAQLQQQMEVKDEQYRLLMEQYNKTGDRVNRVIDQNQQLINTLIDVIKKEK